MSNPSDTNHARPDFSLGSIVATRNAFSSLTASDILIALSRHSKGDWGNLDKEDHLANEQALITGGRLFSAYRSEAGVKFWIITECDRSITTVLLPGDY